MPRLGVNIDHIATIRQARRGVEPDPVWAAVAAELGGADVITVHLREDRRHIQDRDVRLLRETVQVPLNLEMAVAEEITDFAVALRPPQVCLVPEKREEVTTEGGLDVAGNIDRVQRCVERLHEIGVAVSLFIDPDPRQVDAATELQVSAIELHTGRYAHAADAARHAELVALTTAGTQARTAGLLLNAGHGLTYRNVRPVAEIPGMNELNIGHSIIARAVFIGLEAAVREMKSLIA